MKHGSLFSGIGGFDLASEWMGWENVFQVEIDPFCTKVLEKNFPNTKRYGDIRTFPASDYTGRIDVLTGGFPCQPFSQAGKRKGTDDNRHLWPEMLRVIQAIKPTWVIAENVRGLLSIEQGMVFEQVCLDLEANGYEVQPFIIPACSVNAPHQRYRVWFIAHAEQGTDGGWDETENSNTNRIQEISGQTLHSRVPGGAVENVTNTECPGYEGEEHKTGQDARCDSRVRHWDRNWPEVATELCVLDDGLPVELDGFKRTKAGHRNEQIKAYGNAIVPQVAYQIFKSLP